MAQQGLPDPPYLLLLPLFLPLFKLYTPALSLTLSHIPNPEVGLECEPLSKVCEKSTKMCLLI